jgi:hypothetical protein
MVEYVSVSDGIPLIGEMSQHQRAGRCLAEEAALRFWPMLLQKSFWGGDRKFLQPLIPFALGDVRDHVVSFRIDHRPP